MKEALHEQAGIKTIYASNFLHAALWAFVSGQRQAGKDINESIRCFMKFMDCEDVEFNSLKQTYYRKNSEYVQSATAMKADTKQVFDCQPDEIDRVFSQMKNAISKNIK